MSENGSNQVENQQQNAGPTGFVQQNPWNSVWAKLAEIESSQKVTAASLHAVEEAAQHDLQRAATQRRDVTRKLTVVEDSLGELEATVTMLRREVEQLSLRTVRLGEAMVNGTPKR